MSTTHPRKALNINNINQNIRSAQYAVRGELAVRSETYRAQLRKREAPPTPPSSDHGTPTSTSTPSSDHKPQEASLPFDTVISANIGNPQQLDQKPLTFIRQVCSLVENPALLDNPDILQLYFRYPTDVIARARHLLSECKSVGAYSASQGVPAIRKSVAAFIERRDGYPANEGDVFLCAGASSGVNTMMNVMCKDGKSGVLVPIPQYPLYTATLSVLGAKCVPYFLDEGTGWGTDLQGIKESYENAIKEGTEVRALVVINPGNPTGACLGEKDVRGVIEFAAEKGVVVVADEVYQTNVFVGEFTSFKKMLRQMQAEEGGKEKYGDVELVSLNSVSKGMIGECGHRGGYFELTGFDPEVVAQIYKFVSIGLCAPVVGQCVLDCVVNPPKEGEPSYQTYFEEYEGIKRGLKERATALYEVFKKMEGVELKEPQGSMYLFPTIQLPAAAVSAAQKEGRKPDEFYCSRLLDATGICLVPGSGFGQKEGTLHIRTTFLAPGTDWTGRIEKFHRGFMEEFKG
ncbi:uncharacterized protein KY384_002785 [Bacidia gigantensis]|uniref:uncharacterized protein n=1 Tax=Bacidia gigantensis TaxID=2732470 RepID=UPI001D038F36|nr:uncharacterized protein KY384_002785 [Bacidia gigantensis]KAG8532907.1 hypothetical protein KY384_002785 [Bacidia gigantensis]